MKAERTKKEKKEKNWSIPGVNLTHEEFVAGIHKAEEGPFYTLEQMQTIRNQWRDSKKNL
jgi:hypothetical protein